MSARDDSDFRIDNKHTVGAKRFLVGGDGGIKVKKEKEQEKEQQPIDKDVMEIITIRDDSDDDDEDGKPSDSKKMKSDNGIKYNRLPFPNRLRNAFTPSDRKGLLLHREEDMVLFRFLQQIEGSLLGHSLETIFNVPRYIQYTYTRDTSSTHSEFEKRLHEFVNVVNFSIMRMLAAVRRLTPMNTQRVNVFANASLLDVLWDEQAANHFGSLVTDNWKDNVIEASQRFQAAYVTRASDVLNITTHLQYFATRVTELQHDLVIDAPPYEVAWKYKIATPKDLKQSDYDARIAPDRPNLFFVRMCLQAMSVHNVDQLSLVLDRLQHKIESPQDIPVSALHGNVFTDVAGQGYKDALALAHDKLGISTAEFFRLMLSDPYRIVFFAHIVSTCTNIQRITKNKEFARNDVVDRLLNLKIYFGKYLVTEYRS